MKIYLQSSVDFLIEKPVTDFQARPASSGALAIKTGLFTGRSPKDRFIVQDTATQETVWWGDINLPLQTTHFEALEKELLHFLTTIETYKRQSFVGADPRFRLAVETRVEKPWSDLFIHNMFLRPQPSDLDHFVADWKLYCAPSFRANPQKHGTRKDNFAVINFTKKTVLIGGTAYTGEIKKSLFSVMNFLLPTQHQTLPMHCSANCNDLGQTALFFGLSGTGKTTLSTDPTRKLIGDDEHGWTPDNHVFNFEGGCYAKVIDLNPKNEPDIYAAIKRGALLENVRVKDDQTVDFADRSITENTRVSYPIHHIKNIQTPAIGQNVTHVFFLTADAFGVLPPMAQLTPAQAAYHFISGYTAKVAGTETGVHQPKPHFSACYGAPFMPLHPGVYAKMLAEKIVQNNVQVWLINTGCSGGAYGRGKRMLLPYTRAMIRAVLDNHFGPINPTEYHTHSVFGLAQPRSCPGVPADLLSARKTWKNDAAYYATAHRLAKAFHKNFMPFEKDVEKDIKKGGPIEV